MEKEYNIYNTQIIYDPPASTSGVVLFITFVVGAIAAIIGKIYYHTYQKKKLQEIAHPLEQCGTNNHLNNMIARNFPVNSASNTAISTQTTAFDIKIRPYLQSTASNSVISQATIPSDDSNQMTLPTANSIVNNDTDNDKQS